MPTKQRHGCLTSWLVFMLIANGATAVLNMATMQNIQQNFPSAPSWVFYVLVLGSIFNLICAVALLRWKKWGFWGYVGSAIVVTFINLFIAQVGILPSLLGLLGIAVLYGVLQIGKENKGWSQLE